MKVGDKVTLSEERINWQLSAGGLEAYKRPGGCTSEDIEEIKNMLYTFTLAKYGYVEFTITEVYDNAAYKVKHGNFSTICSPKELKVSKKSLSQKLDDWLETTSVVTGSTILQFIKENSNGEEV